MGPQESDSIDLVPSTVPGLRHLFTVWRWLRRIISRRELTIRLLGLKPVHPQSDDPGLILVQVDGLSRSELEWAIEERRMPFLRYLKTQEEYRLQTLYPGQPATTPAVLGELFYGVRQAVPAFSFLDHRTAKVVEMLQPEIAERVQAELERQGEPLLANGAAYCDIYSGGAAEAQFCPGRVRWKRLTEAAVWKKSAVILMNFPALVRLVGRLFGEFFASTWNLVRRKSTVHSWLDDLKFIPRHLIASVILQECTTIAAETDAIRGLRIAHVNFLGYDDLAHHFGPASRPARRALRSIDRSVRRIWNACHASHRRAFQLWLMADHGQETTTPYSQQNGRTIQEAVRDVCQTVGLTTTDSEAEGETARPLVVAIGPLGYVYDQQLDERTKPLVARHLTENADVPIVIYQTNAGVTASTKTGQYRLPDQISDVLGPDRHCCEQIGQDLVALCSHPDAGELVILGWRPEQPLSFVTERGAHAGPGPNETSGFVMAPYDSAVPDRTIRPVELREAVQRLFGRSSSPKEGSDRSFLRVATYNVHGCVGLDGRRSAHRIARVLAGIDADVIALQELDVGRSRSGAVDQAQAIASMLNMELHFGAAMDVAGERYGNAILSRLPMTLRRASVLPGNHAGHETRGAIWATISFNGQSIEFLSTHLGLSPIERHRQIEELLSAGWPCTGELSDRVILCGDLNASRASREIRLLSQQLRDGSSSARVKSGGTWWSPFPLRRLDHIFVGRSFEIVRVATVRNHLSKVASDHLPLVADLQIESCDGVLIGDAFSANEQHGPK